MPDVLGYSNASTPQRKSAGAAGCFFNGCAAISATLLGLTLAMWAWSYIVVTPAIGPNGEAAAPPPGPHIALPMPSDAAQYWVPLRGRLERWEYAGWENKWYRWSSGMILPLWMPAMAFAIVPLAWVTMRWRRRDETGGE